MIALVIFVSTVSLCSLAVVATACIAYLRDDR
jgi:hypothetical protein